MLFFEWLRCGFQSSFIEGEWDIKFVLLEVDNII